MPQSSLSLRLHRWIGLTIGVFLLAIALTGMLLVLQEPLDRALHPDLTRVTPGQGRQPLGALLHAVQAAYPADTVALVRFGEELGDAAEVRLRNGRSVFVNPYDAHLLGARDANSGLMAAVRRVHVSLLAGAAGRAAVGIIGLLCALMVVTGLVRWWRTKILSVKAGGTWKRKIFELHHTLGAPAAILVFVLVLTGGLYAFEEGLDPLIRRLNSGPPPPRLESSRTEGAQAIGADSALSVANAAMAGTVTVIQLPRTPRGVYRIQKRLAGDHSENGRSAVAVNQYTGAVLQVSDAARAGLGTRLIALRRGLHTGEVLGWPTKLIALAVGIVLMHQAVTGFVIWWKTAGA